MTANERTGLVPELQALAGRSQPSPQYCDSRGVYTAMFQPVGRLLRPTSASMLR
jgi:hypothetical protein